MIATFGLIVTLCAVEPGKTTDDCNSNIADTFDTISECVAELPNAARALVRNPDVKGIACELIVAQGK